MTPSLCGLHDIEATAIAIPDSWVIDTIALSENPQPKTYPKSLNIIARLNFGYGSTGTLPVSSEYNAFAQTVAMHVSGTLNCKRWIIANECNLSREWPAPSGLPQPIYPWDYAACYKLCRQAIHALPGHERDEVLVAGSGPWNAELKYSDNPNGDWITYFSDVIDLCGNDQDGFALHAYTHSYDAALVSSTARMASPFESRHYEFRTYQDYCNAIPDRLSHLPCYITEANGNGPWQAVGLMSAMLAEIDDWNRFSGLPLIQCVAFYRYPHYDDFFIEGRADVIAEYQAAVARGYESPLPVPPWPEPPQPTRPGGSRPEPTPPQPTPEPTPPGSGSPLGAGTEPPRDIDPALYERGVTFDFAEPPAGTGYWRMTKAAWYDEQEAQGRVNTYVTLLDEDGDLISGEKVRWYWQDGYEDKVTEIKHDSWLGRDYSCDFAMYNVAPSYGVTITEGVSDDVWGLGLGSLEQPDYKIHTAYSFTFQLVTATEPIPPEPTEELVHPLPGSVITQHFYQNPEEYAVYGLEGHDGTDLSGLPEGTPVYSMAAGVVAYIGYDEGGYGNYVRCAMAGLGAYAFYAHLSEIRCTVGQELRAGDVIGLLGSTGNSTAAHLHLEIRHHNEDGSYSEISPMPKGRVDPETWCCLNGLKL